MRDTTEAAERVRLAAIRGVEPVERLRQAFAVSEWARALALARLRQIHPERTALELVELLVGETLAPPGSARGPA